MALPKLSEHWQVNKSLVECNQYLLENGFGDVTFKLQYKQGEEKTEPVYVPAVRSFLLARSPVFFSMFSGALSKKEDQEPIYVNDVEPEAFHELLRFIYTDQVQLTAHNVMAVLNASKKYIVTNLTKKCVRFLEENISAETAAPLLEQAMFFDEQELKDKVLAKIEKEASAVLSSEDFVALSKQALREVLQLELKVKQELEVFEASMRWAEKKCEQMSKELNGLNKRDVLGDNLFLIRFPTMSVDDMNESVLQHDVLSPEEALQLMRYITAKSTAKPQNIPFSTEPRNKSVLSQGPRIITIPVPYVQLRLCKGCTTTNLQCSISKPIIIHRILVHGIPSYLSARVNSLGVSVKQNGREIYTFNGKHPVIAMADGKPTHYALAVNDVRVNAGAFDLLISIKTNTYVDIQASAPASSQLADDYVTISFSPVATNLLHGIEYSPAE